MRTHRVGFACKVMDVDFEHKFQACRISSIKKLPVQNQIDIVKSRAINNLKVTKRIIRYCIENNIEMYRLSSDIIPLANFIQPVWDWSEDADIKVLCSQIKMLIKVSGIRCSFHPDQFCVINNPKTLDVFNNAALPILNYHDVLSDMLGVKTLVLHIGGVYGDKELATETFINRFKMLPPSIQSKLVLENDKSYNIKEVLDICKKVNAPCVLDYHHHVCYPCSEPLESLVDDIKDTWGSNTPKVHLSSGRSHKTDYAHADYIDQRDYDDVISLTNGEFDVMLECKFKNKALLALEL